jgi:hypothetical protein
MNAIKKITALSTVFFEGYTFTGLGIIPYKNKAIVCITNTGDDYNQSSYSYLRKSKIPISLKNAKTQEYVLCSCCNPPR